MKRWQKLGLGLASIVMGLTLGACSNSGSSSSGSKSKEVSINVFQFKVEFRKQFKEAAKEYEKNHPNVKINITTVGGGSDYGAALKSKFQSGNEPNIFNIGGPEDMKTWKKYLADVSDTKAAKSAMSGTLDAVKDGKQVLGLPYDLEGIGMVYNKAIFKKAGIDASQIKTLDDLETAAKKLDSMKSELGIDAAFAYPAKETWVTGLHSSNPFLALEFNNDVNKTFKSNNVSFKYGKEFKRYVDIENKYSVQPTNSLDYSTQIEKLFANGKVAMAEQGNWIYPTVSGIDQKLADNDMDMFPIPVTKKTEGKLPVGVPNYWTVNKNASSAEVKASKDFLDWLYTSKKGKDLVLNKFKFVPAFKGYDTSKIQDPLSRTTYKYYQEGKTTGWVFMGYPTNWGMNVLGTEIQKYVAGKTTWSELEKTSKAQWTATR